MYKQKFAPERLAGIRVSENTLFQSEMLPEYNERRGGETEEFYYGSYFNETTS